MSQSTLAHIPPNRAVNVRDYLIGISGLLTYNARRGCYMSADDVATLAADLTAIATDLRSDLVAVLST